MFCIIVPVVIVTSLHLCLCVCIYLCTAFVVLKWYAEKSVALHATFQNNVGQPLKQYCLANQNGHVNLEVLRLHAQLVDHHFRCPAKTITMQLCYHFLTTLFHSLRSHSLVVTVHLVGRTNQVRSIVVVQGKHQRLQRVADRRQVHHQLHRSGDLVAERQKAAEGDLEGAHDRTDKGAVLRGWQNSKQFNTNVFILFIICAYDRIEGGAQNQAQTVGDVRDQNVDQHHFQVTVVLENLIGEKEDDRRVEGREQYLLDSKRNRVRCRR